MYRAELPAVLLADVSAQAKIPSAGPRPEQATGSVGHKADTGRGAD